MEKSCVEIKSYIPMGINVAMHVLILFTILSLFFMFYIAPVSRRALNSQIEKNIEKLISKENINIPNEYKSLFNPNILQKLKDNYKKPHGLAETLNSQIENNIEKLISKENINIPNEYKSLFNTNILQKLKDNYKKPHELAETHNKWLFKTIVLANSSLFVIVSLSTVLLMYQCNQCIPRGHILLENMLTFLFVGIVEYLFFTRVALNFVPSKPSAMVNSFLKSLEKNL